MKNMKQFALIILLWSTVVLAKRPEWYPENGLEIEGQCMKENAISAETMAAIRNLHIMDTPEVRALVLCCLKKTNVYRPEIGPEPDRIAVAFRQSIQLNCDMDLIMGCTKKHEGLQPEDYAYFAVIQCIYDEAPSKCVDVVAEEQAKMAEGSKKDEV